MAVAATALPTTMTASTSATCIGFSMMILGSKSMPTETKNSTAKASCIGMDSAAARWPKRDSLSTTPAKKAPSASDTPKTCAEAKAMPMATASTDRVKSSREPVRATCCSSQGTTRGPSTMASVTKAATLPSVMASDTARFPSPSAGAAPRTSASAGRRTRTRTMARSSTMSQPTAMRPALVVSPLRSSSARRTTTVLATDRQSPKTSAPPKVQPQPMARAVPSAVATAMSNKRPRHRHAADRGEVRRREMQADAEHQQDDADLRQLACKPGIRHEARRERADRHARHEIADERWQPDLLGDEAEAEGEREAGRDGRDQ